MKILFLITILSSFIGCVVPILNDPEPYPADKLSDIKTGMTRKEVLISLGKPDVIRDQNNVWLYGQPRSTALIFAIYGIGGILDYQYLLIQFKQDQLSHIEVIEKRQGCSSSGICISWDAYKLDGDMTALSEETIVYTKENLSQFVKNNNTPPENCSVYIYTPNSIVYALLTELDIGSMKDVFIDRNVYLYLQLEPGKYLLTSRSKNYKYRNDEAPEKQLACRPGGIIFLKVNYSKWNMYNIHIKDIVAESAENAEQTLMDKYRLLLPSENVQ